MFGIAELAKFVIMKVHWLILFVRRRDINMSNSMKLAGFGPIRSVKVSCGAAVLLGGRVECRV